MQPEVMSSHYADCSAEELLEGLEWAGRHPDLDLIEECLERPDDLTPGLLEMLATSDAEESWADDDPRWYRMIHAGLLLIHFREEAALPLLIEEFRQSSADTFNEWFAGKLRTYGPPAVPALTDLLRDEGAGVWGRIEAATELAHIAWTHPETRERVLEALRHTLPPVAEDGSDEGAPAPDLPGEVDEDRSLLWANVAYELARLRDEESRPQIETLFARDLLDPMVFGDQEEYRRLLRGEGSAWAEFKPASFDVVAYYEDLYREGQREARWQAEEARRQERTGQASKGGHYEGGTFVRDEPKVGRNDPCPCGSGRKYKHCCG